jgi:hypothetical protein
MPTLRVWIISENYKTQEYWRNLYSVFPMGADIWAFQFLRKAVWLFKDNTHYWQLKGVSTKENNDPVLMRWILWYSGISRFWN